MDDTPIDARLALSIGRLEGQAAALDASVTAIRADLRLLRTDLTTQHAELRSQVVALRSDLSEDKGKWKTLAGVSGIAATVAGAVVAATQYLITRGGT